MICSDRITKTSKRVSSLYFQGEGEVDARKLGSSSIFWSSYGQLWGSRLEIELPRLMFTMVYHEIVLGAGIMTFGRKRRLEMSIDDTTTWCYFFAVSWLMSNFGDVKIISADLMPGTQQIIYGVSGGDEGNRLKYRPPSPDFWLIFWIQDMNWGQNNTAHGSILYFKYRVSNRTQYHDDGTLSPSLTIESLSWPDGQPKG